MSLGRARRIGSPKVPRHPGCDSLDTLHRDASLDGEPGSFRGIVTIRRIILFRHAKSDWSAGSESDHDRPLNRRGRSAAPLMGRFLSAVGQVPDRALTSTAVRARTTVELAARAGGWPCPLEPVPELYGASPEGLLELVRSRDDSDESLLLGGHEPTFSGFAGELVGSARIKVPTAAMVRIDLGVATWKEAAFGSGTLVWLVSPKLLSRAGLSP